MSKSKKGCGSDGKTKHKPAADAQAAPKKPKRKATERRIPGSKARLEAAVRTSTDGPGKRTRRRGGRSEQTEETNAPQAGPSRLPLVPTNLTAPQDASREPLALSPATSSSSIMPTLSMTEDPSWSNTAVPPSLPPLQMPQPVSNNHVGALLQGHVNGQPPNHVGTLLQGQISGQPPIVSPVYAARCIEPSIFVNEDDRSPTLVVLDLNQTLLYRSTPAESSCPTARPYLSTFLRYLGSRTASGIRRFEVVLWSSAMPASVESMCLALGVRSRLPQDDPNDGSALLAIWARDKIGIPEAAYHDKVATVKDLERIWSTLRIPNTRPPLRFSPSDTVLVDNSLDKAVLQPHNHLLVPAFDKSTDRALLTLIGRLHRLRYQSNVCHAIFRGDDDPSLADEADTYALAICRKLSIPVEHQYDHAWPSSRHVGSLLAGDI